MNKTVYFYWDGPMPYLNTLTLESFKKFNPDWKIVLWLGENVLFPPEGVELREAKALGLPKTRHIAQQADLVKWWSLANEGGLVSDMDILYVKPVPDYICEADIGMIDYGNSKTKRRIWTVGFMSGGPNKFYKQAFDYALLNVAHKYQSAGSKVLRFLSPKGATFFDSDIVYPLYKHLTMRQMSKAVMIQYEKDFELPEVTIGWHWYGGGRLSQRKINTIGPDYNEDNVIRRCMNAIL